MNPFPGYLAANLQVAANLRVADERALADTTFSLLAWRAKAIGCSLSRCQLDPECDGSCGDGPGLRDRNDDPIDIPGISDEPIQDLAMVELLIEQLEANGGVRR